MSHIRCVVIITVLFLVVSEAVVGQCPQYFAGQQLGTLQSSLIDEASGIAASRKNADVLWVHNDSGDFPRVFAINTQGVLLGIYSLSGAGAQDWEDIAIGPGPVSGVDYLYLGDIGDNNAGYSSVKVYRVREPVVVSDQLPVNINLVGVDTIELQYPDGPRDAETLMLDSVTKDIYIVSKESPSKVYRAAYPQSTTQATTLDEVAALSWGWAVGGDISSGGNIIIVRGYFSAAIWHRPVGTNLWEAFAGPECAVPLISEPQGEAICFDADGCGYGTVSEGLYQPINYFARDGNCPLNGDINRDGVIDFKDFAIMANDWLKTTLWP